MMLTAMKGTTATARRLKLWVTPWTMPRSDGGNQSCMARVAAGNAPASPNPKTKRMKIRETLPKAKDVATVIRDQNGTMNSSTFLGPKRSANQPPGICPIE